MLFKFVKIFYYKKLIPLLTILDYITKFLIKSGQILKQLLILSFLLL